jgi:hypothetical protein
VIRAVAAEELRAEVHPQARDRRVGLDGDRHARERPLVAGFDRVGRGQGAVRVDIHERVDLAVALLDPLQRGGDDLARTQFAAPHMGSDLPHAHCHEVGHLRAPA